MARYGFRANVYRALGRSETAVDKRYLRFVRQAYDPKPAFSPPGEKPSFDKLPEESPIFTPGAISEPKAEEKKTEDIKAEEKKVEEKKTDVQPEQKEEMKQEKTENKPEESKSDEKTDKPVDAQK